MASSLVGLWIVLLLHWNAKSTVAFQPRAAASCQPFWRQYAVGSSRAIVLGARGSDGGEGNAAAVEAERLLAKARAIRESLKDTATADDGASIGPKGVSSTTILGQGEDEILSKFSLPSSVKNGFRLYLDIGREKGTWMDPRWGASGRRIECTVDVAFPKPSADEGSISLASEDIAAGLVKTVTTKSSSLSPAYTLQSAPCTRLRGGFDEMAIVDGGYSVESAASASLSSSSTLRFCLDVEGTTDGDVTIPEGKLYFALPYFGLRTGGGGDDSDNGPTMALSNKEGTVTVKQMGWHTGWYREESRILGVFRAVPLERARERDKF